jgi:hypothetical protein
VENLMIEATKSTPRVDFEAAAGKLSLRGESYPENAFKFFEPLLAWVDAFLAQAEPRSLSIELRLPYINTSSSKCLMMLLEKFADAKAGGREVSAVWYYDPDNESERECAEEFSELVDMGIALLPADPTA